MRARQVRKASQLEVEHLNKMKVAERVPYSFAKHRTGKEPIKARWVPMSSLVAKEFPPRVQNRRLHELLGDTTS